MVTMTRRVAAEDGLNSGSDEECACTYICDTNYVALTGEGEGT